MPSDHQHTDQHSTAAHGPRYGRRRLFSLAGGLGVGVAALGFGADLAAGSPVRHKIAATATGTATPAVAAPPITVVSSQAGVAEGDLFFTDMGSSPSLEVADPAGAQLWTQTGAASYADFRVQSYRGQPVLTWWESASTGLAAYAEGRDVVTDLDHTVLATVEKRGDYAPDEHEFLITSSGTALITSYVKRAHDLSAHGGSADGFVVTGVLEEIDLASGQVLMRWDALDHIALAESYAGVPEDSAEPWDFFHINSVTPTADGNLLVSARHTWALYKISARTGAVIWRLGGKRSDFVVPEDATFAWQHNAVFQDDGALRLFDNGSDGTTVVHPASSVLWLQVDQDQRTVKLRRRLTHPEQVSASAMGNAQLLANGNVLVGWGSAKRMSELSPSGELLFDATLAEVSYRAYRHPFTA